MPLDNAQFIAELSVTDPPGTDPLNQGDDHIRTTKLAVQQSFPNVGSAVPQTGAQMAQMAIKNEQNTFTQQNRFQQVNFHEQPIQAFVGSVASPGIAFEAEFNTGIFRDVPGRLSFGTLGVLRAIMDATQFQSLGVVKAIDGSAVAPAFSFTGQPGTGMYRPGTSLGFTVNGADAMFLLLGQMRMITDGSAITPAYSFQNDTSTGFYRTTNGVTAVSGGVDLWAMSTNGMFVGVGFVIHANGDLNTATKPGFSFNNDPDCGLYRAAANSVTMAVGGLGALNFDFGTLAMWAGAGFAIRGDPSRVAAQPAYAFTNDTDTGMFRRATNALGFASGGVEIFNIGGGGIGVISGKLCFLNLPTSAGTTGSLWNNGGAVRVA